MADLIPGLTPKGPGQLTSLSQSFPQYLSGSQGFYAGQSSLPQPGLFQGLQSFLGGNPLMSTILGGAGSLFSTGLNFLGQHMQNSWNEKMWHMENEYNSPQAQIQRFLDAGVNPSAAVGAVTGQPNVSGSVNSSQGPVAAEGLSDVLSGSSNMINNNSLIKARQEKAEADVALSGIQGAQIARETWEMQRTWSMRIDKMLSDNDISYYEAEKLRAFAPYQSMLARLNYETMDQTYQNIVKDWYVREAQIRQYNASVEVMRGEARKLNIQNEYDKFVNEAMMAAGYVKEDPMGSYIIAKHEGRDEDAENIANGVEKFNYYSAVGQSTGADPFNEQLRSAFNDIKSAEDAYSVIKQAQSDALRSLLDVVENGSSNDYRQAQIAYDMLQKKVSEAHALIDKHRDEFAHLNELRGQRDPNKMYKEDWIRIGEDIFDYGSRIVAASQFGRAGSHSGSTVVTKKYGKDGNLTGHSEEYRSVYNRPMKFD